MSQAPLKVAIVGSGIAGLAVAHSLQGAADVTLFEAADYFGGHTHTVDVTLPGAGGQGPVTHGVDTGFLVYNERTYPNLINLFAELDVKTSASDMSFSVKAADAGPQGRILEWSGNSLNTVFAQRSNLWNGAFWRMLMDLLRFNRLATAVAQQSPTARLSHQSLGDFLREHRFSQAFSDGYLLPMLGCIWSCPTDQMLHFPVATLVRFCHNHGLLQITGRPRWFTVAGGARQYVEKIVARIPDARLNCPVRLIERDESGVRVITDARAERFDKLVLATHSDQALALLRNPSAAERETLGAVRYQANQAVLHTDASVLPAEKSAWAAWNYERGSTAQSNAPRVCLHYLINRLQPLPFAQPVIVSLNPLRPLAPAQVLGTFDYAHPVFDATAIAAQSQIPALQGQKHTYYAGAWMGYGFHEDGLKAGLSVARALLPLAQR